LDCDSMTPRVVLAHFSTALSFNLKVSYMILWPFKEVLSFKDGCCFSSIVPMDEATVSQAMARTGRGMVAGSGGIVMSNMRADVKELCVHSRVDAFVWLHACGIKPLKGSILWQDLYEEFPEGFSSLTALSMVKTGMPVRLALKYLGRDGLVADKFSHAVNFFSQPDHFPQPSDFEYPVGYEGWFEEPMDGNPGVMVKVPVKTSGMLRVQVHAMWAIAFGLVNLRRWRYEGVMAYGDAYDSDSGVIGRKSPRMKSFKHIENPVRPMVVVAADRYAGVRFEEPVGRRSGSIFSNERVTEAFQAMQGVVRSYAVPVSPGLGITGFGDEPVRVSYSTVNSPGGRVVCEIEADVATSLNLGQPLTSAKMISLLDSVGDKENDFAASKVFDMFSSPWDSYVDSLTDRTVVDSVVRVGKANKAYKILASLNERFGTEMLAALSMSNFFKRRYLKVFRTPPRPSDVIEAVRNGKFDSIAQTKGFIDRLEGLKSKLDQSLIFAESSNVYLPHAISAAQRIIPAGGSEALGTVGRGLVASSGRRVIMPGVRLSPRGNKLKPVMEW